MVRVPWRGWSLSCLVASSRNQVGEPQIQSLRRVGTPREEAQPGSLPNELEDLLLGTSSNKQKVVHCIRGMEVLGVDTVGGH